MRFARLFRPFGFALFACSSALALSSCSKSDSDASSSLFINFGPGLGYDMRTGTNLPTGQSDPTDWQLDGKWNASEQKLFSSLGLDLNGPVQSPGKIFTAAYPNPCIDQFTFSYRAAQSSLPVSYKVLLVNKFYQVMLETDSPTPAANRDFVFTVSGQHFQRGQLYRVYYVMYNGTTLYHKGHGDIKVDERQ